MNRFARIALTVLSISTLVSTLPSTASAQTTAQSPHAAPVVLRFRYWGDFKEIAVIGQTIAAFERDHPGVTVHGERVPPGDEYAQKLLVEQAAGLTPDVIFCGGNYAQFAGRGVLADLGPLVAKDPTVKLTDYYPQLIHVLTLNNHLYALPRDIAPMGLIYYNKSLFDKAHIPYPDGTWRWDFQPHPDRGNLDFLTVASKLTQHRPTGGDIYGYAAGDTTWTMNNFVYSQGASYVDDIFRPTTINYRDPKIINAIQLTQNLAYKYNVSPSSTDLASSGVGSHELFAQGRVAMYLSGIWEVPRFRDEIKDFDWDIAPFPMSPTGHRGVQTGWSGYGLAASSKHKAEAWMLIKYLAGPVGLSKLAQSGLAQPGIARLANSTLWLDGKRPINRKLTTEEVPYVQMEIVSPNWDQVYALINPKLQLVWSDTITAQQAVDAFSAPAQAKLDSLNHPAYHPKLNWGAGVASMGIITLLLAMWVRRGAIDDIRSGRARGSSREVRAGWGFISPWIIGATVFVLAPMLVSLVLAFSSWDIISPARWVGAGNFQDMMTDDRFGKSLKVTMLYTLFSVPLGVAGSMALALLLNAKIRGQAVFRTLYYIPSVASAVAASLIWLRLFNPESGLFNALLSTLHLGHVVSVIGLTDPGKSTVNWLGSEKTALGAIVVTSLWGIGGGMVIFLAGLQGIPQSYYDAADVDGANLWHKFRHVTLPLLTPTIFFNTIMGVIGSFQVFTQGFVMTNGGPNDATLFYVLYLYQNAFQFLKMGYASALAWVLLVIILGVTVLQMRFSRWVHYEGAEAR